MLRELGLSSIVIRPELIIIVRVACALRSPKYYVESENLIVKGEPGWESGDHKNPCWDPKNACDNCEPDLIDSPPKYLDGYCKEMLCLPFALLRRFTKRFVTALHPIRITLWLQNNDQHRQSTE